MSPEERELFKRSISLAEQNNDILRSIQRSMRVQRFMTMVYWLFIVGSAVGAYYLIQPYLEQLVGVYTGAGDVLESFKTIGQ